jgi:hypothetical protein
MTRTADTRDRIRRVIEAGYPAHEIERGLAGAKAQGATTGRDLLEWAVSRTLSSDEHLAEGARSSAEPGRSE